jgi:hypothetical protein
MENVIDNRHRLLTANTRQLTPDNKEPTTTTDMSRQGHSTFNSKHRQPTPEINNKQLPWADMYNWQRKEKNPTTDKSKTTMQIFINWEQFVKSDLILTFSQIFLQNSAYYFFIKWKINHFLFICHIVEADNDRWRKLVHFSHGYCDIIVYKTLNRQR